MKTLSPLVQAIDVVIVSFNCKDALIRCLNSLRGCRDCFDLRPVVVDNASTDRTQQAIRSEYPDVEVIENTLNLGFATACNQGILLGHEDFVLLLNPDCEVGASALRRLVDCLQQDKSAACAAPGLARETRPVPPVYRGMVTLREFLAKMLFLDRSLYRRASRKAASDGQEDECTDKCAVPGREVDYVVGACVLCRRLHLESVGLLDPGFFLYFEDQDLSLRLRERGFRLLFCAEVAVEHAQGASADREVERTVLESYRSLCYFFDRHKDKRSALALRLAMALGATIRLIVFSFMLLIGESVEARSRIAAYRRVVREIVFRRRSKNDG
ncbi:MAG: glycosyltransferase family 2 protein [Candidatus Coatesbacteria bacterium]|nr:glycosyltransferase family 2 protein [Candidatus Coatesbacteria bacterium]